MVAKAVPLIQERLETLAQAPEQLRFLFGEVEYTEKAQTLLIPRNADVLAAALEDLGKLDEWAADKIKSVLDDVAERLHLKRKEAFQPIRAAVTFSTISPPLPESMELLGKERSLQRIGSALGRARGGG